jgi:hypothetical protein
MFKKKSVADVIAREVLFVMSRRRKVALRRHHLNCSIGNTITVERQEEVNYLLRIACW